MLATDANFIAVLNVRGEFFVVKVNATDYAVANALAAMNMLLSTVMLFFI